MDEYFERRKRMVERLKDELKISEKVAKAMLEVPRHLFVPPHMRREAYNDYPLPIGYGQTISAPHMVAIMCDLLDLKEGERVLEVGTGSGYHAAVVSRIVGEEGLVVTVERIPELAETAKKIYESLCYDNIKVVVGDGSVGYEELAPYDKIYVTASAPKIPVKLLAQLKNGGRMVIPVGDFVQHLYVVDKDEYGRVKKRSWGAVRFVPLIGEEGFED
ncbi:protein-L-isoaspartate{D-aspartate} O-methyltransferase [Geoglobus ahangari]|uniref:Protein-L-isoaspartate O-methyltransferase n=1 Tax=Geoglobus ahangari TaxID=113653 RepID=A0A0F7IDC0_9EURY|nr:protein-L-isoaspartate O-methyltransferase [Geoglobus ahangari]AKG91358.1 protein-L-isoaspartate{D-aspartate} O-methyltransferase [Geoglobus ahangari]